ncbi:MAG: hypothetical protein HQ508_01570 [Candidatus Marinimicrobia bacterium]|nr:hypothetical protein [Candidatus Neomarinimicrobiota bacterium]
MTISIIFVSPSYGNEAGQEPANHQVNRHMMKNFIKSLIIPGWGQWDNGNKVRAVAYLTAEIAGIYTYNYKYSAGVDKEVEFKIYGDEYWYFGDWSPTNAPIGQCGSNLHTHNMPLLQNGVGEYRLDGNGYYMPVKDHHFYENIGKYPEFSCGWDDFFTGYDEDESTHKAFYISMRTLSNKLYRDAQITGTLIMLNHLVSAFDAAFATDMTTIETSSFTGKLYINPLNVFNRISLEVKF